MLNLRKESKNREMQRTEGKASFARWSIFQLYRTGIACVQSHCWKMGRKIAFGNHIIVLDRAGTAAKIAGIRYLTIPAYNHGHADREMLQACWRRRC